MAFPKLVKVSDPHFLKEIETGAYLRVGNETYRAGIVKSTGRIKGLQLLTPKEYEQQYGAKG